MADQREPITNPGDTNAPSTAPRPAQPNRAAAPTLIDTINKTSPTEGQPFAYTLSIGTHGASGTPQEFLASVEYMRSQQEASVLSAVRARTQNAMAINRMYGTDIQTAFEMEPEFLRLLYPGQKVSSETLWGRLQVEYDKKALEQKISVLRFAQLHGDTSEETEARIQEMRMMQPVTSRLDEISQMLIDPNVGNKFFLGMEAIPYVITGQLPMWIEQAKVGGPAMAVLGGLAAIGGAPIGAFAGAGLLIGSGLYELTMEAGLMYDEILTEAKAKDIDLDMDLVRRNLMGTAAIITAFDTFSFGNIAARGLQKPAKKLALGVLKNSWRNTLAGDVLKKGMMAFAEEGLTEGLQELIGNLGQSWIAAQHEASVDGEALDIPTFHQMMNESLLALTLAGPMAFFLGGAPAAFTAVRTHVKTRVAKGIADFNIKGAEKATELGQESVAIATQTAKDVDIAESEMTGIDPDDDLRPIPAAADEVAPGVVPPAETVANLPSEGRHVRVSKIKRASSADVGGPAVLYAGQGVKAGEHQIMGSVLDDEGSTVVYVRENGAGPMVRMSLDEAVAATGQAVATIRKKAKSAREAAYSRTKTELSFPDAGTPQKTVDRLVASLTAVGLPVTNLAIFREIGGEYTSTQSQEAARLLYENGAEIVGTTDENGSWTLSGEVAAIETLGWSEAFKIETVWDAPQGAKIRRQKGQEGVKGYYYYADQDQAVAEPVSPEQAETEATEEAEAEAEIDESQATEEEILAESAASGVGPVQVQLADDDIVRATNAVEYGRRPRGWKKHSRIDFSGQKIKVIEDLAVLFSLFRSPHIEQSHAVFIKDGVIVANNSISAGLASMTPWIAGKSGIRKYERLNKQMKRLGADEVYFVHNHPNGNTRPSTPDNTAMATAATKIPGYAGDIILNHNDFSYTPPGAQSETHSYDPQVKYDAGLDASESLTYIRAISNAALERGTGLLVMLGSEIRAVLTPTKKYSQETLFQMMKYFGGDSIVAATTDITDYSHYAALTDVPGKQDVISLAVKIDETTGAIEDNGVTDGDASWQDFTARTMDTSGWLWSSENLKPLLDEVTDNPEGPVPNTVKKWRKFWNNLIRKYHITRPNGLTIVGAGSTLINVKTEDGLIGIDATAGIVEGVSTIELKVQAAKQGSEPYIVTATVSQGETGIEAAVAAGQEVTEDQVAFVQKYLHEIAQALYQEGIDYKIADLNISEAAREAIDGYTQFRDYWRSAAILTARKGHSLKEKIGTLANELVEMAKKGQENTHDYEAIKSILWEMAQARVELEGMAGFGINKIKYMAAALVQSRLTPGKLKAEIRETVEGQGGFRVRLPLTKKEEARLAKIKEMDPTKVHGTDTELLEYSQLPGIETLTYNQLLELQESLELFDNLRLKATEMKFFGVSVSLEAMLKQSLTDIHNYRPEDIKDISPAEATKRRSIWMKSAEFFKNFLVDRQTQYFKLIEHIAGKDSIVYHTLYRNLESADRNMREMRHRLQDMYSGTLMDLGINQKQMGKWADEVVVRGGLELTNSQALEIYMHSLTEDNWQRVTSSGIYFSDQTGVRHYRSPEAYDFQAIADEMQADPMAVSIGSAFREVYDSLGRSVGETYQAMFGKPFENIDNYYPIKVARESYEDGGTDLNDMTLVEEGQRRITLAHSFIHDRLAESTALELSMQGAFHTLAVSLEQETKFVHMELPFFQASKLLYDPDFKASVTNSRGLGQKYWDLLESGLQDWAGRQMDIKSSWDSVFLFVRRQATRAGLGLNPFSALKAGVSWFYAMRYVDPRHATAGLARLAKNGKAEIEMLMKKSPVFRDRVISGALPEVNDILKGQAVKWAKEGMPKKGTKGYDNLIFSLIQGVDKRTVAAVMLGAIDQALDAFRAKSMTSEMKVALNFDEAILPNMSAEEQYNAAVAYAEYVLQRTQPDFRPQSRNQFQRGTSLERLASVFGSFVTITHNMAWDLAHRIRREGISAVGVKEVAWTLTLMVAVSAGNEGLDAIKKALLQRDQATMWELLSRAAFNNTFIIRDINQMVISKLKYGEFAGHGGADSYTRFLDQAVTGILATTGGLLDGDTDRWMAGVGQMTEALASFSGAPVVVFGYGTELIDKRIVNK